MRIWDIPVSELDDKHLMAEHYELHCIWSIIVNDKRGYSRHPETQRWRGKLSALYTRHELQVAEIFRRKFRHKSYLNMLQATGSNRQDILLLSIAKQRELLRQKGMER